MSQISQTPMRFLQNQLATSVTAGTVKSSDQSVLSSALSDIDSSLQQTDLKGAAPSKSTIDSLISKQVSSGKLTSEQADELQSVFGSFAANGGTSTNTTEISTSSDLLTSNEPSTNSVDELLNSFIKSLKGSTVSGYSSSGTSTNSVDALLIDYMS